MSSVANVYKQVINDVIENVKNDFKREGVDESVLDELKKLWEAKLLETGVIPSTSFGLSDMYSNFNEEKSQTHTAQQFLEQVSTQQTPYSIPYGYEQSIQYQQLQEPSSSLKYQLPSSSITSLTQTTDVDPNFGRPQEYMPPTWTDSFPNNGLQQTLPPIQNTYLQKQQLPLMLQQPTTKESHGKKRVTDTETEQPKKRQRKDANNNLQPTIPQVDGNDDDLNSDDDVSSGEEDAIPTTQNVVLAQFEKVSRAKNKWKCTLKSGIMHLKGVDYLFNRATGEFDW